VWIDGQLSVGAMLTLSSRRGRIGGNGLGLGAKLTLSSRRGRIGGSFGRNGNGLDATDDVPGKGRADVTGRRAYPVTVALACLSTSSKIFTPVPTPV
jgi:hypothetical protein